MFVVVGVVRVLQVRLLGPIRLQVDGAAVQVSSGRLLTVLTRLALAAGKSVSAAELVADVWGEDAPLSVANSLQVTISSLRKLVGHQSIVTSGRTYSLAQDAMVDVAAFRAEVRSGLAALQADDVIAASAWLARALGRWAGTPFLGLEGAAFLETERNSLVDIYLAAVEAHASIRIRRGEAASVVTEMWQLIDEHPYHEGLRAELVLALAVSGRQVDALAAYEQARATLAETFGIDPGRQLRSAHEAVLRGELPAQLTATRSGLRLGLTSVPGRLIGREREMSTLTALCADPTIRLVTMVGVGGVGKTRLAQELVLRAPGDATYVSLLPAQDSRDVAGTICESLGVSLGGRPAEDAAVTGLANHPAELLLVLDNFEHVLPAAELVDSLLRNVPGLTVAVTSRSPLGLDAEQRLTVKPLPTVADADELSIAGTLLLDRIRRVDADFQPTGDEVRLAGVIASLCEGLPLAIEIAAARAAVLDLTELHQLLEQPLSALVSPSGGPGRWSSVRASIQWSIDALNPQTARILAATTVFRGGFTVAALAAVTGLDRSDAGEHVHRLIDHSLLRADSSSSRRRFDVLQVIREVATDRLTEAEQSELRDRHVQYFRSFLGPQPNFRAFPNTQSEFEMIAAERPNLRAAVRHAATMNTELLADLVVSLSGPWCALGMADEMRGWLDLTLARPDLADGRRVDALMGLVRSGMQAGGALTDRILAQVWAMPAATSDPHRKQWLTCWTASNGIFNGKLEDAAHLLEESQDEADQVQDPVLLCQRMVLIGVGQLLTEKIDDAIESFTKAWDLAIANEFDRSALICGQNLSEALLTRGSAAEAADVSSRLITMIHRDDRYNRSAALSNLGAALVLLGRDEEATDALRSALLLSVNAGWTYAGFDILLRLAAATAHADPDDDRPSFLLGLWAAGLEALDVTVEPFPSSIVEKFLGAHRDAPASSRQGRARAKGRARVGSVGAARAFDVTAAEELGISASAAAAG